MYFSFGGCTTLFHLAVRYPAVVLALSLSGFVYQANSQAPGNLMGTDGVLQEVQKQVVAKAMKDSKGDLTAKVAGLKMEFDKVASDPTEEQVRTVLNFTDACTDATVKDVLSDPDKRREAAWLLYLDVYSREGPARANSLFPKQRRTSQPLRE